MSMSHPLSDMLTRIEMGKSATRQQSVVQPRSWLPMFWKCWQEGYIRGYAREKMKKIWMNSG